MPCGALRSPTGPALAVKQATELSNLFDQARYAVVTEESLERKYRLEPGEGRAGQPRAPPVLAMVDALTRVAATAAPEEHRIIESILLLHRRYRSAIERMFAAVDANDTNAATAIDSAEVDPAFDDIEPQVVALSDHHRTLAADRLRALTSIQTTVMVATPVVFALGTAMMLTFWRVLRNLQKRSEQGLAREAENTRSSERRFRGLVQNTSDIILICAPSGTATYQSPAAESAWGFMPDGLLGQPVTTLTHPDDQAALRALWDQLLQTAPNASAELTRTTELRFRDGSDVWRHAELVATNLLDDPAVQGVVVTVRDVSERRTFEQQLLQQAFYDALTGLPNRALFRDRLGQALVRAGRRKDRIGLLFLDLDNFKLVNDSLGHQMGDKLLVEAAERLRTCIRAQDTIARLSGDEFVIVLELLADETDAIPVAKAIAHQFARPFTLDGRDVVVTASIGIAISNPGRDDVESLVRNADVAMYRAKSDGRARYVMFDHSMHTDALARLELENDLRHAIDHQELRVHYQPIISMDTGSFTEVEALVRWQHPSRGLVSPADFIPIAEETGLIIQLGMWVLEEACRQVVAWHEEFPATPPLTLSVNLSPRQFQQASLVGDIAAALEATGLPACRLKLEITEGVIMRDTEATIRTLWELKDLGLQLAIDDFGTGYSSLSYLKRLPLDVLKIDRSFVSGIGHNQEDNAIVHAVMALAKSLHLQVTGEGIETAEQATLLSDWGCDRGQGYLFSRPLDGQKADALLRNAAREAQLASNHPDNANTLEELRLPA